MLGTMMDVPLNVSRLIDYAGKFHADTEIVTRTVEGGIHRYSYADAARRSRKLANALTRMGIGVDGMVATLAWNTYRHLECYYGISGIGAVCHTVNPRLFADQIAFILADAADSVLFVDLTFLPLVEGMIGRLPALRHIVVLTDRAHMPTDSTLPGLLCYEELIADAPDQFVWPVLDERTGAFLCYTSGTTGNPRGVLYTHRSVILHAWANNMPDSFGLSALDCIMPVVPMFHVNAWGIPFQAPMVGAKLVLPGAQLDGASLHALLIGENVTMTGGVPTLWIGLLEHVRTHKLDLGQVNRIAIGGSAVTRSMVEAFQAYGVRVIHAWGMTETGPGGALNAPTPQTLALPPEERLAQSLKQGRPPFGVDLKIVDPMDQDLPRDGVSSGALRIQSPWAAASYFNHAPVPAHREAGWFDTGDIATIDQFGFVEIVDRTKDIIKTGGEWVSSILLESILMDHPAVAEAAAIARPDDRWGERPVVVAVLKAGASATAEELRGFYADKVVKWQIPDEVIIVDAIPHTGTGKIQKLELRRRFASQGEKA